MQRIRVIFAFLLLLLFLPIWRFTDMLAFTWPHDYTFGVLISLIVFFFIALPARLLRQKTHWGFIFAAPVIIGFLSTSLGALSPMATDAPEFNHCGRLTYTGFIYPARGLLSAAHQDDLEIRNQICWLRKMVVRMLPGFSSEIEYVTYSKLVRNKLLKPERKYRVSLPLIGLLYGNIIHRWDRFNIPLMKSIHTGKLFLEEMEFWTREYTEEVSDRDYGWWDWLHGNYIKWEYGIIEENWQGLLDGTFTN